MNVIQLISSTDFFHAVLGANEHDGRTTHNDEAKLACVVCQDGRVLQVYVDLVIFFFCQENK